MNNTYASLTQSDSDDMDSSASTPVLEHSPGKRNTIRDLIVFYEQKLKATDALEIPPDVRQRLHRKYSADNLQGLEQTEKLERSGSYDKETDFYNNEKKKVKAELSRTLTQIRKNYARRVNSSWKIKDKELDESPHLFECCLLVELNMSTFTPYVKGKYPLNYEVPPWVEHLCYPDATEWSPESLRSTTQNYACQCYSLVITNEKGERKFGYCRRVLPEGASVCLPLAYCIISSFRAPGFYHKVLQELESRHGLPNWLQNAFLHELYVSKFPKPGQTVTISCLLRVLLINSLRKLTEKDGSNNKNNGRLENPMDNNDNIYGMLKELKLNKDELSRIDNYVEEFKSTSSSSPTINIKDEWINDIQSKIPDKNRENCILNDLNINICTLMLNLPNSQLIYDCLLGDVVFKRPKDHRSEDTDLTVLFETLNLNVLLQTFGSLLLERKVILVSKCLSQLSSCVEAMQSILYPFSWQHTFIPVLSNNMLDILNAPLPLVAGVLASHLGDELIVEDGFAINLDTSTVICSVGDESRILPKRLRSGLSEALKLVTTSSVDDTRNVLVSEAFTRMFIEVCGHYCNHITENKKGEKIFNKEAFVKQHSSKSLQNFLEWFTETSMFQIFIHSQIDGTFEDEIFQERCEAHKSKATSKRSKMFGVFFNQRH